MLEVAKVFESSELLDVKAQAAFLCREAAAISFCSKKNFFLIYLPLPLIWDTKIANFLISRENSIIYNKSFSLLQETREIFIRHQYGK